MGQGGSCIQGSADWSSTYTKHKKSAAQENFLYEKLSELILLSTISKNYRTLEKLLCQTSKSFNDPPSTVENKSGVSKFPLSSLSVNAQVFEDVLKKEVQCKGVNFNFESKDIKPTVIKPIITSKYCLLHGPPRKSDCVEKLPHSEIRCRFPINSSTACQRTLTSPSNRFPSRTLCDTQNKKRLSSNDSGISVANSARYSNVNEDCSGKVTKRKSDNCSLISQPTFTVLMEEVNDILYTKNFDLIINETWDMEDGFLGNITPCNELNIVESAILATLAVKIARESVYRMEDRAENIVETFALVLKHLEHGDWSAFCINTSRLCNDIKKVLKDYIAMDSKKPEEIKVKNHVESALNDLTHRILGADMTVKDEQAKDLLPTFQQLGDALHELMEYLIGRQLIVIVDSIQHRSSFHCVKEAIFTTAEMAAKGSLMVKLLSELGAIQSLLAICEIRKFTTLKSIALRTLSILCSMSNTALQFSDSTTLSSVSKILTSEEEMETVKCEAVSLLVQILKEWNEHQLFGAAQETENFDRLVKALKNIASKSHSSEIFLLATASLLLLSSFNEDASAWLQSHELEIKLLTTKSKQESYV